MPCLLIWLRAIQAWHAESDVEILANDAEKHSFSCHQIHGKQCMSDNLMKVKVSNKLAFDWLGALGHCHSIIAFDQIIKTRVEKSLKRLKQQNIEQQLFWQSYKSVIYKSEKKEIIDFLLVWRKEQKKTKAKHFSERLHVRMQMPASDRMDFELTLVKKTSKWVRR